MISWNNFFSPSKDLVSNMNAHVFVASFRISWQVFTEVWEEDGTSEA